MEEKNIENKLRTIAKINNIFEEKFVKDMLYVIEESKKRIKEKLDLQWANNILITINKNGSV